MKPAIGQRFVLGFPGTRIPEEFKRLVRVYKVENVILFKENIESGAQARDLCAAIDALVRAETGHPALIALDEEGGVVSRLPPDMVKMPGAMALAAAADPAPLREAAALTARQLAGIGVNLNLAPVLDVNSNPANPVIGCRSLGASPERVAALGAAVIRAYREAGFACCAKHFPGHGDTAVDSHLDLPRVDKTRAALDACELAPFRRAVAEGVPAIMTSHIVFPALEGNGAGGEPVPATMSRRILHALLRRELGFTGLIITDALEMKAVKDHYGVTEGALQSLRAGADLVCVCHDLDAMEAAMKAAEAALAAGGPEGLDPEEAAEAAVRITAFKSAFGEKPTPLTAADAAHARERARDLTRLTMAPADPAAPLPVLGERPLFVGCLPYRSTIASSRPETSLSFTAWFARRFNGAALETPVNPGPGDVAAARERARDATAVVMGTYNGHLNGGQIDLARALAAQARASEKAFALLALRNPYDLALVPEASASYRLAVWEYTETAFEAAADVLAGVYAPTARLEEYAKKCG